MFTASTEQDLLDVLGRILPSSYLDPLIRGGGPGYEAFQAAAAAMARCSAAVQVLDRQALLGTATGGSFATALVAFQRPTTAAGALTIKAGTVVTSSGTRRDFVLLNDVALGAFDLTTLPVVVQAVAQSYEFNNCLGPRTTADGTIIPGDIDTVSALITSPDYADQTITVAQQTDAAGGASGDLDALGKDLDVLRKAGETDTDYRARLRQLPDTVSPAAVKRLIASQFGPFTGLGFSAPIFIETYDTNFVTSWDVPSRDSIPITSPLWPLAKNSCFFYDDTRGPTGPSVPGSYYGRWLDLSDYRGAFIVVVPWLPSIDDHGMFYDDPSPAVAGPGYAGSIYSTSTGSRGTSAFDAAGLVGPQGCFDGTDLPWQAVYVGLYSQLQAIKAAGVTAEVILLIPQPLKDYIERFAASADYASRQVHSAGYAEGVVLYDALAGLGGRGQAEGASAGDAYTAKQVPGAAYAEGAVAGDALQARGGRLSASVVEGAVPGEALKALQKGVAAEAEGALAGDAYARGFGVSEAEGASAGDGYDALRIPFAQQTEGVVLGDVEDAKQNEANGQAEGTLTGDGYNRS